MMRNNRYVVLALFSFFVFLLFLYVWGKPFFEIVLSEKIEEAWEVSRDAWRREALGVAAMRGHMHGRLLLDGGDTASGRLRLWPTARRSGELTTAPCHASLRHPHPPCALPSASRTSSSPKMVHAIRKLTKELDQDGDGNVSETELACVPAQRAAPRLFRWRRQGMAAAGAISQLFGFSISGCSHESSSMFALLAPSSRPT